MVFVQGANGNCPNVLRENHPTSDFSHFGSMLSSSANSYPWGKVKVTVSGSESLKFTGDALRLA